MIYLWPQLIGGVLAADLYTIIYRLDIEKQHWKRYQIIEIKSNQYQHYKIGGTGKHDNMQRQNKQILASSDF